MSIFKKSQKTLNTKPRIQILNKDWLNIRNYQSEHPHPQFTCFKVKGWRIVSGNGILIATESFTDGNSFLISATNQNFKEKIDGNWLLIAQVPEKVRKEIKQTVAKYYEEFLIYAQKVKVIEDKKRAEKQNIKDLDFMAYWELS